MLPLLRCFFAHLLILQYPDHHQNLISSSLYYSGPVHKISSQSVHNFLSNVHRQTNKQTDRQTDRQTDKLTNATKNITSFAKEVITVKVAFQGLVFYVLTLCKKAIIHQVTTMLATSKNVYFQVMTVIYAVRGTAHTLFRVDGPCLCMTYPINGRSIA